MTTVIVDEIHAIAGAKRGVHLALSLERLAAITDVDPQRIGLSATQRPLEEIAGFLGGDRPVAIVVAHPAAGPYFLRREMLYTAMTRARMATLIVGVRQVVARAAATPDTSRRYSRLAVRLAAG